MSTKSKKFTTCLELIQRLSQLPPDARVDIVGADIGGYDVSGHPFGFVYYDEETNTLSIDHGEHEAWLAWEREEISYEDYEKEYH